MTGSGADHWVGINHVCPGCGAKSGGLIPKGHYRGCPDGPPEPTQEQIQETNRRNAAARAANQELCRQIANGEVKFQ